MKIRFGFIAVFLLMAMALLAGSHRGIPGQPVAPAPFPVEGFGRIPLYFIPNMGQVAQEALFYARTPRYNLWLTAGGMVFETPRSLNRDGSVSRLVFVNARSSAVVEAGEPAAHKVNYLKGKDKSRWYTGIPTSMHVRYRDIYENINLKVYGMEKQIEYDWVVKPGGDPASIVFQYEGVGDTFIDDRGNLAVSTAAGQWMHKKPLAFQVSGSGKETVDVRYKKLGKNRYGFHVGAYDRDRELVIDPLILAFYTFLGGTGDDDFQDIALDASGNIYACGASTSTDFPLQTPYQGAIAGGRDVVVAKFTNDGTGLLFSTYIGGDDEDNCIDMELDSTGAIYVAGLSGSSNFPTVNPYQGSLAGNWDGFIFRLSADGSTLLYSTYFGGMGQDWMMDIALNNADEIYVTGVTYSFDDFPLQNALQSTYGGGEGDAFLAKLNASGSGLLFSTYLGGSGGELSHGLELDASGNIFVAGNTASNDFPVLNAYQSVKSGGEYGEDGFVTKVSADGSTILYSTYLGGDRSEFLYDIAVDASGAFYVAGSTYSLDFPVTPGAFQEIKHSSDLYSEGFLTKFTADGSALTYSTYLGGTDNYGEIMKIAPQADGTTYVTGNDWCADFPVVDTYIPDWWTPAGAYVARFSADGSSLLYSSFVTKDGGGNSFAMEVDGSGAVYVAGMGGGDWTAYEGYQETFGGGNSDGYVAKLVPSDILDITITYPVGGEAFEAGSTVTVTWTAPATVQNVMIDSPCDPSLYITIPNTGSFEWTVPDNVSPNCTILVGDAHPHGWLGTESQPFSIVPAPPPPIDIIYPNGGEFLDMGSQCQITWTPVDTGSSVFLFYSTNGGADWTILPPGVMPDTGSYDWTVPWEASGQCKVKVENIDYGSVDESDGVFTIVAPTITVTAPDGGENLYVGAAYTITWNYSGFVPNVYIYYSTDNGNTWKFTDAPLPTVNQGFYNWTVPDDISDTCLVKVECDAYPVWDVSSGVFAIKPSIPQHERDALIALYNSTGGDNWTDNSNWRKPGDPAQFNDRGTEGTWAGVTLNADGTFVDKLDFTMNNLTGAVPSQLNDLTELTELRIQYNSLNSSIPNLSSLMRLTTLFMGNNGHTGAFPAWLNNLPSLYRVALDGNQLTGPLPDLSNLTGLTLVNFSDNQLTGSIPWYFNTYTNLYSLYLSRNQLSGAIPDMSNLANLKWLNLEHNQLTGSVPVWLNTLPLLERIELTGNQLTGGIPDLSALSLLVTLKLGYNQLSGEIPAYLDTLSDLYWIDLSNNQFTGPVPALGSLNNLDYLYLDDNRLSGTLPPEIGDLPGLRYLWVKGNQLEGEIPGTWAHLHSLSENGLNLSWNALYSTNGAIDYFLDSKHGLTNYRDTQTIVPKNITAVATAYNKINVSWTPIQYQDDSGGYKIFYSPSAGGGYTLMGTTADKSVGSFEVTGLQELTTYYFKVQSFTNSHANNQNAVVSEISAEVSATTPAMPTLTIITPNGSDILDAGANFAITWSSTGNIDTVDLEYSTDNGASWLSIISGQKNTGSYDWLLPAVDSDQCLVRISDPVSGAWDVSDGPFEIWQPLSVTVTVPNGGESWTEDSVQTITWLTTGKIEDVRIEYTTSGGKKWADVVSSTVNTGSFQWTVPKVNKTKTLCKIRITALVSGVTDISDNFFTIVNQ